MEEHEQRNNNLKLFLMITIFLGSVFLTSEKFVDPQTTPKLFISTIGLFVLAIIMLLSKKQTSYGLIRYNIEFIFKGFYIIGTIQAVYGITQYAGTFPSNHSIFPITGSFENPAGFAAVLSMLFPAGLYWAFRSEGIQRIIIWITIGIYISALILSGSRTGMLAMAATLCIFMIYYIYRKSEISKKINPSIIILIATLPLLIFSLIRLNMKKTESTNGRLLVWRVSAEMIKEKPIFGHGAGSFKAKYMEYQADYFINKTDSKYRLLADSIKHPFNEYIKLLVEFGVFGFILLISILLLGIRKIAKKQEKSNALILSIIASFLVFACFSYPLTYPPVWVILIVCTTFIIPSRHAFKLNNTILTILRFTLIAVCITGIFYFSGRAYAEIVWKKIATESLRGKTKEMLPQYEKLYPVLKINPYFLYNYAAELNEEGYHDQSLTLLKECRKKLADYDVLMLEADNYRKIGKYQKAILSFERASAMVPSKFLPFHNILEISQEKGLTEIADKYANEILNKEIKIPSMTVNFIKNSAREYLNKMNPQ
jgi:O-antigen polymerase